MRALFRLGAFTLASGGTTRFKIDCDALTAEDWEALAALAADCLPPFGAVEGVPTGGLAFADALRPYATGGPLLIADDVLTTGSSMERLRGSRETIGVVAFSRAPYWAPTPRWITPLFVIGPGAGAKVADANRAAGERRTGR